MSRYRFRDDESSSTPIVLGALAGAVAGFLLGMVVSQEVGGLRGMKARLRRHAAPPREFAGAAEEEGYDDVDAAEGDEAEDEIEDDIDPEIELSVLEAFRDDPVLCERAVDIGSLGAGIIELAGSVDTEKEAAHAVAIARAVPGVETVVNRLVIGDDEAARRAAARRFADGDPSLSEAHWEGNRVGTGRRRQGTSAEPDRHADPKVPLQERWAGTDRAIEQAADDGA